jgi:hypothetical protein
VKTTLILFVGLVWAACASESHPGTGPRRVVQPRDPPPARKQAVRPALDPPPLADTPPAQTGVKVDCQMMCNKTFMLCVGEVLVATGKVSPDRIRQIQQAGAWHKVQQAGYTACMKDCAKKKGFGSDAVEINKCLALSGCTQYAQCIKKHIK